MKCEECCHVHRGGFCHEVCEVCMREDDDDFDADELGIDPEEDYDA